MGCAMLLLERKFLEENIYCIHNELQQYRNDCLGSEYVFEFGRDVGVVVVCCVIMLLLFMLLLLLCCVVLCHHVVVVVVLCSVMLLSSCFVA